MLRGDPLVRVFTLLLMTSNIALVQAISASAQTGAQDRWHGASNAKERRPFHLIERMGPFAVGLRVVEQYDPSRMFPNTSPPPEEAYRPLQTLIWYPARKGTARPSTFSEYIALQETEISFGHPQRATGTEARRLIAMAPSYNSVLKAVRNAPARDGHFPVVIYAPSFSAVSWENADLCEYLASFGYVVLAVPAMGVGRESTHDVTGTNEQARDISFLIDYSESVPYADPSEIAVVGFSWGGIANLFAASRDGRIKALVALDGSMRYFPGVVSSAGDVHPDKMTIPLLYFEGQHSLEDQDELENSFHDPGPSVLNEWTHGDLIAVSMQGLVHSEFSSRNQRNEAFWADEFPHLQEADYGRMDGEIGYAWVSRYTREFLDEYLKRDAAAEQFLGNSPHSNGVPLHVLAVNVRKAQP